MSFNRLPLRTEKKYEKHDARTMYKRDATERLKLSIFSLNKLCGRQAVNRSENPHYAYT